MIHELIYTSAVRGLSSGSRGFCTVATTPSIPRNLVTRLEALSSYRHLYPPHDRRASRNPPVYSHLVLRIDNRPLHVLSRIADAGLDYTKRSNKLAHHVALTEDELVAAGPAWLMSQPGFFEDEWKGPPSLLVDGRELPQGQVRPAVCRLWNKYAGEPGWSGELAKTAGASLDNGSTVIFRPGMNALGLVAETLALLPEWQRWDVSFSTYFTGLPPGVGCDWRFVAEGSTEAKTARNASRGLVIDLCRPLHKAPDSAFVRAARGKSAAASGRRPPKKPPAKIARPGRVPVPKQTSQVDPGQSTGTRAASDSANDARAANPPAKGKRRTARLVALSLALLAVAAAAAVCLPKLNWTWIGSSDSKEHSDTGSQEPGDLKPKSESVPAESKHSDINFKHEEVLKIAERVHAALADARIEDGGAELIPLRSEQSLKELKDAVREFRKDDASIHEHAAAYLNDCCDELNSAIKAVEQIQQQIDEETKLLERFDVGVLRDYFLFDDLMGKYETHLQKIRDTKQDERIDRARKVLARREQRLDDLRPEFEFSTWKSVAALPPSTLPPSKKQADEKQAPGNRTLSELAGSLLSESKELLDTESAFSPTREELAANVSTASHILAAYETATRNWEKFWNDPFRELKSKSAVDLVDYIQRGDVGTPFSIGRISVVSPAYLDVAIVGQVNRGERVFEIGRGEPKASDNQPKRPSWERRWNVLSKTSAGRRDGDRIATIELKPAEEAQSATDDGEGAKQPQLPVAYDLSLQLTPGSDWDADRSRIANCRLRLTAYGTKTGHRKDCAIGLRKELSEEFELVVFPPKNDVEISHDEFDPDSLYFWHSTPVPFLPYAGELLVDVTISPADPTAKKTAGLHEALEFVLASDPHERRTAMRRLQLKEFQFPFRVNVDDFVLDDVAVKWFVDIRGSDEQSEVVVAACLVRADDERAKNEDERISKSRFAYRQLSRTRFELVDDLKKESNELRATRKSVQDKLGKLEAAAKALREDKAKLDRKSNKPQGKKHAQDSAEFERLREEHSDFSPEKLADPKERKRINDRLEALEERIQFAETIPKIVDRMFTLLPNIEVSVSIQARLKSGDEGLTVPLGTVALRPPPEAPPAEETSGGNSAVITRSVTATDDAKPAEQTPTDKMTNDMEP